MDAQPAHAAFFGGPQVTILTPTKTEAIRSRPVVAIEDVIGAQRLSESMRQLGLSPSIAHIPIGGAVDLDHANLVIICGPRLSPTIARVLDQDPVLRFDRIADGPWTLLDRETGARYWSGQDEAPTRDWDIAYLARLPRLDGAGSLLIFTGIHPPGSPGVVNLLCEQVRELWRKVGVSNFSVLVGTEFASGTHEPRSVKMLTPIYRMEATDAGQSGNESRDEGVP